MLLGKSCECGVELIIVAGIDDKNLLSRGVCGSRFRPGLREMRERDSQNPLVTWR
jgi:hypothetical protein